MLKRAVSAYIKIYHKAYLNNWFLGFLSTLLQLYRLQVKIVQNGRMDLDDECEMMQKERER
jgi:hypothetical protein